MQIESKISYIGPTLRIDHHVVTVKRGVRRKIRHFRQAIRIGRGHLEFEQLALLGE